MLNNNLWLFRYKGYKKTVNWLYGLTFRRIGWWQYTVVSGLWKLKLWNEKIAGDKWSAVILVVSAAYRKQYGSLGTSVSRTDSIRARHKSVGLQHLGILQVLTQTSQVWNIPEKNQLNNIGLPSCCLRYSAPRVSAKEAGKNRTSMNITTYTVWTSGRAQYPRPLGQTNE